MMTKMEKLLLALFGLACISVLSDAQDIGRMRRLMLLRQRELAFRRAGFPFGIRGIGGPGIPPPVAARLALLQRQRALNSPFLGPRFGPLGTPFSPFSPTAVLGLSGPFGLTGPTDFSRFDISTLNFPSEATFGGPDGLPVVGTDGLTVSDGGITTIGSGGSAGVIGQQGGSGNIFGQQPTQAEEFLETNRGTVEQRSNTDGRSPGQPTMSGFRSQDANPPSSRSEIQRMQRPPDRPPVGDRRAPPRTPPQSPGDNFSPILLRPLSPPVLPIGGPPQLEELRFPRPQPPIVPLDPRGMPPRSPRRRGGFETRSQQRSRQMRRRRREQRSRGPRVFPNVPDVVQIPSVTPVAQGQPGDSSTGLTQAGAEQMGGQMNVQTGGQMGGQIGGPVGGQIGGPLSGPVSGQFGGSVGGPMGGQVSGQFGGAMGGPMRGPVAGQMGGAMGGPMRGPVSGQMGGAMGGPMRGPISGQMGGAMGGPMRGPISGQMGGAMGGPMRGPISGQMGGAIGGPMRGPISGQIGGTMGGPMRGPIGGPMGGPGGSPFGGQAGGPFRTQMTGPNFSFARPSSGQFSTGFQTQGGQGSAIFPSQVTQGPIIRQRGPGFTTDNTFTTGMDFSSSSSRLPGFPNGPALQFPGGAQGFGQSSPLTFPSGGLSPDVVSTSGLQSSGFPGFPGGSFGQRFRGATSGGQGIQGATFGPSFDATPTQQTTGQILGGNGGQNQIAPQFGFVEPSDSAAGPAFNTGAQSTQNFNIQFQPLQPGRQVPRIPEQQPSQGQMGIGTSLQSNTGMADGFSSQGQGSTQLGSSGQNFQSSGSSQDGFQFGGTSQTGVQTGSTGQSSKFTASEGPVVVETKPNQPSGGISFGSNSQSSNSAATTVSERTVEAGAPDASAEFRLVEVGNIIGDKGFLNTEATSVSAVATETMGAQQGSAFQPAGDINTAFRSFEAVGGSENIVDLSLDPVVTMTTDSATVSKTETIGSTIVTNTSETGTVLSVEDNPFSPSIKQDFSFFMTESNQAPNEMPPITFTAPEPPVLGSGGEMPPLTFTAPEPPVFGADGTRPLTFSVEGTRSTGKDIPTISQPGFSLNENSVTTVTAGETVTGQAQPDTTNVAGETAAAGL